MDVPSDFAIIFDAAARRPEGLKFGFCFSTVGLPSIRASALFGCLFIENDSAWEGRGPFLLLATGPSKSSFDFLSGLSRVICCRGDRSSRYLRLELDW